MTKPANAEYIKEIIEKTNGLGYLDIQGDNLTEKQEFFKQIISGDLALYDNDVVLAELKETLNI